MNASSSSIRVLRGLILIVTCTLTGCFCVGDMECIEGPGVTFRAQSGTADTMLACFNGVCTEEVPVESQPRIGDTNTYLTANEREGVIRVGVYDAMASYSGDPTVLQDGDLVRLRLLRGGAVVYDEEHRVDYEGSEVECECLFAAVDLGAL